MSEAAVAVQNQPDAQAGVAANAQNRITELKVSGHLMLLEPGLFCIFQAPGSAPPNESTGLPGVRISLPPGPAGRPEAVSISTFRGDGWLEGLNGAALVRVTNGPAHVLVTIYQAPNAPANSAPRLQVTRLSGDVQAPVAPQAPAAAQAAAVENAEIVAHVQRTGDVPGRLGDWIGTQGSQLWIEGFGLTPRDGITAKDVEYQAVLGRGWLSPWIEGGKFCGSRGMALPLLGLKVRLRGNAAKTHECSYSATFVDGSAVGPVQGGETCEAESLAALEAFQIVIRKRGAAAASGDTPARTARGRQASASSAKPAASSRRTRQPG